MFSFPCHFFLKITSNTRAISSWTAAQQEETGVHGVVKAVWAKVPLLCPVLPCSVWACCLKRSLNFPPKNRNPSWMVWGFYIFGWWQMGGEEGKPNNMSLIIPFTKKVMCSFFRSWIPQMKSSRKPLQFIAAWRCYDVVLPTHRMMNLWHRRNFRCWNPSWMGGIFREESANKTWANG